MAEPAKPNPLCIHGVEGCDCADPRHDEGAEEETGREWLRGEIRRLLEAYDGESPFVDAAMNATVPPFVDRILARLRTHSPEEPVGYVTPEDAKKMTPIDALWVKRVEGVQVWGTWNADPHKERTVAVYLVPKGAHVFIGQPLDGEGSGG